MILVLGADGQLGSHFKILYPEFEYISRRDFPLTNNWYQYERLIIELKPDIVINCTAYTKVDLAETETEEAEIVNVKNVSFLAEYAKKFNYKLIHFSTDYVFDGKEKSYTENFSTNPISFYGQTKKRGEDLVLALKEQGLVIRTSWLFGPSGSNFVQSVVRKLKTGEELKIVNDQKGSPTYTKDLVQATLSLKEKSGLYHFSNSGSTTWFSFAKKIKNLLNFDNKISAIKTKDLNLPAKRPRYSILDCNKYKRDSGKEIRDWKKALKTYLSEIGLL